ncbi:mechanosensitive ion channel family protein [Salidesulfovibrio brasiliensis]|uniref:mechanosensitive ion channel family protein n=1 Tax=Salidesulfovibrio brasiliensis TaxID=221711 RepID=UPI0006D03AB3|nr:mechanosensitive ion channel family protein [Salidesulfovibrio brasiliensis]
MDIQTFFSSLQQSLGVHGTTLPHSVAKIAATGIVVFFILLVKKAVMLTISRLTTDHHRVTAAAGWIGLLAYMIIGLAVIRIWFEGLDNFLTFLGIIAVGLTIVSKELILNFVAFWVIIWRDLFTVGQRVQVGDTIGDVTRKGILYFSLMEVGNWVEAEQSTGRLVRIPNALVLTQPVVNYTKGFRYIWNELTVTVDPESNWRRAREIMTETATTCLAESGDKPKPPKPVGDEEFIIFRRLTPKVYLTLTNTGYRLTLRYLCRPRERRDSANTLLERILDSFEREGIKVSFQNF